MRPRRRPVAALLSCLSFLLIARSAKCVQAPRVEPGARIRFTAPNMGDDRLTGTLRAWERDTLAVTVDEYASGLLLIVPTDSITRLDVRRERRMTLEGMGLGVLAGALVAVAASPDWVDENGNCTTLACLAYRLSPDVETRIEALGVFGAVLGAIAGSGEKSRRWETVPLRRLSVGATRDGGVALGIRISF